jgi:hypothetical protein
VDAQDLRVSDNGPVIPEALRTRQFDELVQVSTEVGARTNPRVRSASPSESRARVFFAPHPGDGRERIGLARRRRRGRPRAHPARWRREAGFDHLGGGWRCGCRYREGRRTFQVHGAIGSTDRFTRAALLNLAPQLDDEHQLDPIEF